MSQNDLATSLSNEVWELCCKEIAAANGIEWPLYADRDGRAEAITQLTMSHGPTVLALHEQVMPRLEAMQSLDPLAIERLIPEALLTELHQLQQEGAL